MISEPDDSPEVKNDVYQESRRAIRFALNQYDAMKRALEMSMDAPGGMAWEEEIGGPILPKEPEPTPETVAPMEEPTEPWEVKRLSEIRKQMEDNWPTEKLPFIRRPWRSNK